MPTYAYRCNKCGDEFEVVQSMTDAPLKRCKKCRGALKRVFHPVGIVLKGSGFYKTDYGSRKSSSTDGGESSGAKSSDSKSSESKSPDSKASDAKASDSKSKTSDRASTGSSPKSGSSSGAAAD